MSINAEHLRVKNYMGGGTQGAEGVYVINRTSSRSSSSYSKTTARQIELQLDETPNFFVSPHVFTPYLDRPVREIERILKFWWISQVPRISSMFSGPPDLPGSIGSV